MTVYVRAEDMPLVLEFLGTDAVDEVSAALEQAVAQRYVLTVELRSEEAGAGNEDLLVNLAAIQNYQVGTADPRRSDGWDDRLIYSLALPEFVRLSTPDPES